MRSPKRWMLTVLAAAVLLFDTTPAYAALTKTEVKANLCSEEEWQTLVWTNKKRLQAGLEPLTMFDEMQKATDIRKKELTESFSHIRPNGIRCFSVLDEAEVENVFAFAENIARGYETAEEVVDAWMGSKGHNKNMMGDYQHLAVGEYNQSWVQLFADCEDHLEELHMVLPDSPRVFVQGTEIEEFGEMLEVTCKSHGSSYLPLVTEMCTGYDKNKIGRQTIKVQYKDLSMSFEVQIQAK